MQSISLFVAAMRAGELLLVSLCYSIAKKAGNSVSSMPRTARAALTNKLSVCILPYCVENALITYSRLNLSTSPVKSDVLLFFAALDCCRMPTPDLQSIYIN